MTGDKLILILQNSGIRDFEFRYKGFEYIAKFDDDRLMMHYEDSNGNKYELNRYEVDEITDDVYVFGTICKEIMLDRYECIRYQYEKLMEVLQEATNE